MKNYLYLIIFVLFGTTTVNWSQPRKHSNNSTTKFRSLAFNQSNMRVGPGFKFPIKWVYTRKGWPLEVLNKYENWMEVRDYDGETGWVHKQLLSKKRSALIKPWARDDERIPLIFKKTNPQSILALMAPKLLVDILICDNDICKIRAQKYTGWVNKHELWGIKLKEIIK